VTIYGFWIGNQIYWTLKQLLTTSNYNSFTHSQDHCNYSTHKVFSVFTNCCLVVASNSRCSPYSGFPNCPWSQLPASHFSQLQLSADSTNNSKSVGLTLRVAVYRQSSTTRLIIRGGFFFSLQLNPCCHSPYATSSPMIKSVCLSLMNRTHPCQVYVSHT
jgi:hypothetical protein